MKVIGYLDKEKYRCMSEHLITNEVIITEERIQHIQEILNDMFLISSRSSKTQTIF